MWRAFPIWLKTWSAATHIKSGYINSTIGRKRPSSAIPPPSPANAFSLIGVPKTRSGYFFDRPFVAPFVPPLSRWISSPRTTTRLSLSIAASITPATASTNFIFVLGPESFSGSKVRAPLSSEVSPRTPTLTKEASGHSSGLILRFPGASGFASSRAVAAKRFAASACSRTESTPA
ncbi:unannotated protein [freshwater metagenome]|uniref:Unannotated protein n=1 Tax=freshwater metagenome TaxID=449393 RepID=A0A6J7L396_9ZZZZ